MEEGGGGGGGEKSVWDETFVGEHLREVLSIQLFFPSPKCLFLFPFNEETIWKSDKGSSPTAFSIFSKLLLSYAPQRL